MFWKRDEKLETIKDLVGSKVAYIESVKMLGLKEEEKDIFMRASIEVNKRHPNRDIIDKAYVVLVGKSYQGEGNLIGVDEEPIEFNEDEAIGKLQEHIGDMTLFMEFFQKYNPTKEERALLSITYQDLRKRSYDIDRIKTALEILDKYLQEQKVETNETYTHKKEEKKNKDDSEKLCTKCGAELRKNAKFCSSCGTPVKPITIEEDHKDHKKSCKNCNATLKKNAKFCSVCGTPVSL